MDLDLSKYEGHTPGPWECDPNDVTWIRTEGEPYGPYGNMHVADLRGWGHLTGVGACGMDPSDAEPIHNANARLIADAPLLLAEVRRLREERDELQRWKELSMGAFRESEAVRTSLVSQLTALRKSHARLLKEMYFQRERWVLLKQVPDDPGDQAACAIRNLDAAVAEAEAL